MFYYLYCPYQLNLLVGSRQAVNGNIHHLVLLLANVLASNTPKENHSPQSRWN